MSEKKKGLLANTILYAAAFAVGLMPFVRTENIFAANALFTATATLVIFIVTCFYPDTSLYDPYWSVAPFFMLAISMIKYRLFGVNALLMLVFTGIWATRLTLNWYVTYKGLGHEDWRYAHFRKTLNKYMFALVNFVGLQFVPTIVVYAGLVGALYVLMAETFTVLSLIGYAVMLLGVWLEYMADTSIHRFLKTGSGKTCDISVWKYSRHPNYLGEMTFWTGIFIVFAFTCPDISVRGLGFILIILLFLCVSVPMMEKHNLERRPDYRQYIDKTPMLLPVGKKLWKRV